MGAPTKTMPGRRASGFVLSVGGRSSVTALRSDAGGVGSSAPEEKRWPTSRAKPRKEPITNRRRGRMAGALRGMQGSHDRRAEVDYTRGGIQILTNSATALFGLIRQI